MVDRSPSSETTQVSRPTKGGGLRWLLVALAVMGAAALIMRFAFPTPKEEVYNPPPLPPKTVADVEKQIKDVQNNKGIPASAKGRILGFLQADLQKVKAAEGGQASPKPK